MKKNICLNYEVPLSSRAMAVLTVLQKNIIFFFVTTFLVFTFWIKNESLLYRIKHSYKKLFRRVRTKDDQRASEKSPEPEPLNKKKEDVIHCRLMQIDKTWNGEGKKAPEK